MNKKSKYNSKMPFSSPKISILLIEDQAEHIAGLNMILHHLGYDITISFDGGQALLEVQKKHFDLIILDWNMPHVSGREFLNGLEKLDSVSKDKRFNQIIIYTGCDFKEVNAIFDGESYCILDIWRKPLIATEILKRLKDVIEFLSMEAA